MLNVKFGNYVVNPQRSEAPEKTFSSEDVPHGTRSVIYKAAKILRQNYPSLNIYIPTFTEEQVKSMIEQKESQLSVSQVLLDENPIDSFEIKYEGKVFTTIDFTSSFMLDKIDELMGKEPRSKLMPGQEQTQKTSDPHSGQAFCSSEQEAKQKIIDETKHNVAKFIVERRIEECLDVPELTDEFLQQFETFDAD